MRLWLQMHVMLLLRVMLRLLLVLTTDDVVVEVGAVAAVVFWVQWC